MATMSSDAHHGAQKVVQPYCCPAARALPPDARAHCQWIAATALSFFPACAKVQASICGSAVHNSRRAHPCGKGEPGEQERSEAGAAGVQLYYRITRHHYPCVITPPRRLMLTHAVSSF